jgi:hypothetical protein
MLRRIQQKIGTIPAHACVHQHSLPSLSRSRPHPQAGRQAGEEGHFPAFPRPFPGRLDEMVAYCPEKLTA